MSNPTFTQVIIPHLSCDRIELHQYCGGCKRSTRSLCLCVSVSVMLLTQGHRGTETSSDYVAGKPAEYSRIFLGLLEKIRKPGFALRHIKPNWHVEGLGHLHCGSTWQSVQQLQLTRCSSILKAA